MMATSNFKIALVLTTVCIQLIASQSRHNQYAHILQDTRNEPTPDGHFGYLYKTEDGITSSARGDPSGVIHGTFSYTDPTGLKVNYNYNAGSRFTPGYKYNDLPSNPAPAPKYKGPAAASAAPARAPSRYREPQPSYREEAQYYREPSQEQYVEPAPQYRPRARPAYRDPGAGEVYQQRRNRPAPIDNELYDDYNYRG